MEKGEKGNGGSIFRCLDTWGKGREAEGTGRIPFPFSLKKPYSAQLLSHSRAFPSFYHYCLTLRLTMTVHACTSTYILLTRNRK